jgi:hypothetical protein
MKRRPYAVFALLVLLFVQGGCSTSVLQLRGQPDLHFGGYRQKLADKEELAERFLACTRQAHDEPLSERRNVGISPDALSFQAQEGHEMSVRPLVAVIETVRSRPADRGTSLSVLANVLGGLSTEANARIDLGKLTEVIEVVRQWQGYLGLDEDQLEQDASRFARMLSAYNTAYFGDLRFAAEPAASGDGLRGVVKVASNGFVDRSGNALLFPGISAGLEVNPADSVRISATTVDSQRVSADLMRIFLEAFFDAAYRVPAVHGATALRVGSNPLESPYPEFDANRPMISLEALARVTRDALRAEAAVTALVGKAVRGGSVFGTQNETVAATLETAAGVIAKKLAEHEGFCYYQVIEGALTQHFLSSPQSTH